MGDELGSSANAATAELCSTASLRVLGPLVVACDGRELHVAGTQRRRLLTFLASRPGRPTAVDAIVDVLWPDDPPPSAAKTLQSHVVRLRQSLAPVGDPIATVAGGYRLDIDPAAVDAVQFESLLESARAELADHRPARARALIKEALALWRGTPYIDADGAAFADAERVRLDELRLAATEDLAEAELLAGAAAAAVPELERLVNAEPGRERAWMLLMRCLYALGRQHDALVAFHRTRRVLAETFGLEPGPALCALERQVLDQDPALELVPQGVRVPAPLRSETTFLGRDTELAWLRDAWSVARGGTGQVCIVSGPPGSGRTELAAALARLVVHVDGAAVDYVRVADGFDAPSDEHTAPLLLVLDDVDQAPASALAVIESLADGAPRLSLLLVLLTDRSVDSPASAVVRRIEQTVASSRELGPMRDTDLRTLLHGDGVDDESAELAIAVSQGLPGVARREAAAWMERTASDRLSAAAATSVAAVLAAEDAHDSVFDEVLALVAARARRDALSSTWCGRKPYRALAPYGIEDADLFVGRERLVAELAARVLDRRLVAVVGASGSGKSSLVRAGLDPLVRSGRLPGGVPWRTHVMVPGMDPAGTLLKIDGIDEPGPQLLIVDQFEEIAGSAGGDEFARKLLDLVLDAALDVHVVVVMRADQYGTLARSHSLIELVGDAQVLVGPPTDDELRRIVTQPARRTGCTVEPELVELLVADVAGQDGTLPLTSAALAEVWECRRDNVLTADQYVEIGGLAAAVERLGERALDDAPADDVRGLLLRLVNITNDGQWVRRRLPIDELPQELSGAADALVAARLVVRDGGVLDVVHEIVFRAWPRLASWLEDARADLTIDRDLRIAARVWADHGRSDDDVYRGGRLEAALVWLDRHSEAGTDVVEFVAASSRVAEQEHRAVLDRLATEVRSRRRLGRALAAAGLLLVVSLVGALLAVRGQRSANDARRDAVASADAEREAAQLAADREAEAASQRSGRQAERLVGSVARTLPRDPQLATLLAVEASRRFASVEARSALHDALIHNIPSDPFGLYDGNAAPMLFEGFAGEPIDATAIDISADGSLAVAAGAVDDGNPVVLLIDVASRERIHRFRIDGELRSIDLSDDGRFVLLRSGDRVRLIDVATERVTTSSFRPGQTETGEPGFIDTAFFLPTGDHYVVAMADGRMTLWDRAADKQVETALPNSPLGFSGLAPDGTLAVARGDVQDGEVVVPGVGFWDPFTGADFGGATLELPPGTVPRSFSFSSDMRYLAAAAIDALLVWDLTTGRLTAGSTGAASGLNTIEFHPGDPELLAVGGTDGQIRFYDVAADENVQKPMAALGEQIVDLEFNADGSVLVGISVSGLVGVWKTPSGRTPTARLAGVEDPAWQIVGRRLLVHEEGSWTVIDSHDPAAAGVPIVFDFRSSDGAAQSATVAMSADGSTVVAQTSSPSGVSTLVTDVNLNRRWELPEPVSPVALSPDGTHLVAVDSLRRWLSVWDLAARTRVATADISELGLDRTAFAAVIAPDGKSVLLASSGRILSITLRGLDVIASAGTPLGGVASLTAIPSTDDVIVSGGAGGAGWLARVELDTGNIEAMTELHGRETLVNLVVSADGSVVVAARGRLRALRGVRRALVRLDHRTAPRHGPGRRRHAGSVRERRRHDAGDTGARAQARGPRHRSALVGGERLRHRGEEPHVPRVE